MIASRDRLKAIVLNVADLDDAMSFTEDFCSSQILAAAMPAWVRILAIESPTRRRTLGIAMRRRGLDCVEVASRPA